MKQETEKIFPDEGKTEGKDADVQALFGDEEPQSATTAKFDIDSIERKVDAQVTREMIDLDRKYRFSKHRGLYIPENSEELDQLVRQRGMLEREQHTPGQDLASSAISDLVPYSDHAQLMKYVEGKEHVLKWASEHLPEGMGKKAEQRLVAKIAQQFPRRVIAKWKKAAESLERPLQEYKAKQRVLRKQQIQRRYDVLLAQKSAENRQEQITDLEKRLSDAKQDYDSAVEQDKLYLCPRIESDMISFEEELSDKKKEFISLSSNCERAVVELDSREKEIALYGFAASELERFKQHYEQNAWEAERLQSLDASLSPLLAQGYSTDERFVLDNEQDMDHLKDAIQDRLQQVTEGNIRRQQLNSRGFLDIELDTPADSLDQSYQKAVSSLSDLRAKSVKK